MTLQEKMLCYTKISKTNSGYEVSKMTLIKKLYM